MQPFSFDGASGQILNAFLASFLAGMATGIGSLAVLFMRRLSVAMEDILLSSAAGIMLAASFFSLIVPALDLANGLTGNEVFATLLVISGLLAGAMLLWQLNHRVPHEHLHMGREGPEGIRMKRIWLFILAITLHNLPEGTSVGVAMMQQDISAGEALAVGIGVQNIPEGLAVSVALLSVGYRRSVALLVGAGTGLVEPLGGFAGAVLVWLAAPLLPFFLAVAAGAMLYVIVDEIVPETHRRDASSYITFSLLGGFCLMMLLDVILA